MLRSVFVGEVWNGFFLRNVRDSLCHAGSVVVLMVMVTGLDVCSGIAGFLCSGVNDASPWAADASEGTVHLVEVALFFWDTL